MAETTENPFLDRFDPDRILRGKHGGKLARWTGLEPATPGVTGRYSNQLSYHRALKGQIRGCLEGVKRETARLGGRVSWAKGSKDGQAFPRVVGHGERVAPGGPG